MAKTGQQTRTLIELLFILDNMLNGFLAVKRLIPLSYLFVEYEAGGDVSLV